MHNDIIWHHQPKSKSLSLCQNNICIFSNNKIQDENICIPMKTKYTKYGGTPWHIINYYESISKCQGLLDKIPGAIVKQSHPFSIEDETLNSSIQDKADIAGYSKSQFSGSTRWELSTAKTPSNRYKCKKSCYGYSRSKNNMDNISHQSQDKKC